MGRRSLLRHHIQGNGMDRQGDGGEGQAQHILFYIIPLKHGTTIFLAFAPEPRSY